MKGKESRSDLQVAVTESDLKSLWKVDPKKKVLCMVRTKFKINLIKFT